MIRLRVNRDERGAAAVEMAFALPVLVVMLWAFVQLAQVYRAVAGIQQALGEGARYATLCYTQSATGCAAPAAGTGTSPAAGTIKAKIYSSVYGIGPGTFTVADPALGTSGTAKYYDLTRHLLAADKPDHVPRADDDSAPASKRVWISGNGTPT